MSALCTPLALDDGVEFHQLFVKYDGNSSYTVVMLNTPKEGISRFTCCMIEIKLYVSLMHTIGLG